MINVLKPPGMTSHDVVSVIRRIYGVKRVGHAGTLDPAAAGVLPVFIGNSTRLIEYLAESDKTYRAQITFGYETDTGDDTGQIVEKIDNYIIPPKEAIEEALESFIGELDQIPPMYSAIKVQGKKLYELARAGITVERKPRKITIHSLCLLDVNPMGILIETTCSKGTYIRSLCRDIGQKLGILAVMSFLVRTRAGKFNLADARTLEEIENDKDISLLPADDFLEIPVVRLCGEELQFFKNGRSFFVNSSDLADCSGEFFKYTSDVSASVLVKALDNNGNFIGIGRISKLSDKQEQLAPMKVIAKPETNRTDGDEQNL